MNSLNVVNWIGVFALAVASLISLVQGGYIVSLFAVLLCSILVTSLLPINGKMQYMLRGIPRIDLIQMGSRWIGIVGCWVLSGVGGWEYVPAAVVLTMTMIWQGAMKIKEMRGRRRTDTAPAMIANNPNPETDPKTTALNPSLTTPQSPPQYTRAGASPTSTVRIVEEKQGTDPQANQVTIKIEPQPIFNV